VPGAGAAGRRAGMKRPRPQVAGLNDGVVSYAVNLTPPTGGGAEGWGCELRGESDPGHRRLG